MERLFGFGLVTGAIAYSLYRWYYTDHRLEFHATVVTNVDNQPIGLSEILNAVEDVLGRQSSVANDAIDDVDMEDVSIDDVDMEDISIDDVDMEDVHDAEGLYLEDEGNDEYNMDYDEENFCPAVYYNADESQTRVLLSHPQQNPRKSKVRKKRKALEVIPFKGLGFYENDDDVEHDVNDHFQDDFNLTTMGGVPFYRGRQKREAAKKSKNWKQKKAFRDADDAKKDRKEREGLKKSKAMKYIKIAKNVPINKATIALFQRLTESNVLVRVNVPKRKCTTSTDCIKSEFSVQLPLRRRNT